jgi:hypothetical protein
LHRTVKLLAASATELLLAALTLPVHWLFSLSAAVDHRYQLPRSLQELKLVVPAERKPAALAALLQVRTNLAAVFPCLFDSF